MEDKATPPKALDKIPYTPEPSPCLSRFLNERTNSATTAPFRLKEEEPTKADTQNAPLPQCP
jgi:hypothetical protein